MGRWSIINGYELTPRKNIFLVSDKRASRFFLVPLSQPSIFTRRKSYPPAPRLRRSFFFLTGKKKIKFFLSDHPEIIRAHTSCGRAKVNNRRKGVFDPYMGLHIHTLCVCVYTHIVYIVLSSIFYQRVFLGEKILPERKNFSLLCSLQNIYFFFIPRCKKKKRVEPRPENFILSLQIFYSE